MSKQLVGYKHSSYLTLRSLMTVFISIGVSPKESVCLPMLYFRWFGTGPSAPCIKERGVREQAVSSLFVLDDGSSRVPFTSSAFETGIEEPSFAPAIVFRLARCTWRCRPFWLQHLEGYGVRVRC